MIDGSELYVRLLLTWILWQSLSFFSPISNAVGKTAFARSKALANWGLLKLRLLFPHIET
jgi:hypothetical protein